MAIILAAPPVHDLPGPVHELPNLCGLPGAGAVCDAVGGAKSAVSAVTQVADFASDPLGYIATKMQQAAEGLAGTVLPAMNKLTQPDLSADYFRSAYAISFALAIFVFTVFIGWNFVLLFRRRISGDELAETMGFYVPLFFGGVLFGPLIGTMLLQLTGALTDSLISWGITGSVGKTTDTLKAAIAAGDPGKITGGAVVAIIFFFCLIIALVLAFVVLLVMLVTLYLTGAIIPLSLVWLVHPRQRSKGLKVLMVWVGICFSHVLLFFLLGVAFKLVAGLSTQFDDPGLTILAHLAVAVIALLMATLSPYGLMKFAPVGPSSADGGGPSIGVPSGGKSGGGYPESSGDSQTAQMSRDNASSSGGSGGGGGGGSGGGGSGGGASTGGGGGGGGAAAGVGSGGGGAGGGGGGGGGAAAAGGAAAGGLMAKLAASKSGGESGGSSGGEAGGGGPGGGGPGGGTSGAESSDGAGGESGSAAPSGARRRAMAAKGGSAGGEDPNGSAAQAGDGAGAMDRQGQKAQATGSKLSQAGAMADATGVGAPVGAAMQAAGEAVKAGGKAASATAGMAQAGGDMAAEHMQHSEGHDGGGSDAGPRPGW